jgi:hypothetical protein
MLIIIITIIMFSCTLNSWSIHMKPNACRWGVWNIGSAKWEADNDVRGSRAQENLEKMQHISYLLWPTTPANTGSGGAHRTTNLLIFIAAPQWRKNQQRSHRGRQRLGSGSAVTLLQVDMLLYCISDCSCLVAPDTETYGTDCEISISDGVRI